MTESATATASAAGTAYRSALEVIAASEPDVADAIAGELASQRRQLKLILGTPALTTLGFGTGELDEVADVIVTALRATRPATSTARAKYDLDPQVAEAGRRRCADLLARHRLYPEIEL